MLDSFLIHRDPLTVDTSRQILDSSSTTFLRILNLDTSQHLLICWDLLLFYIKVLCDFSSFLLNLSRLFLVFSPPKHSHLSQKLQPTWFSAFSCLKSLSMISLSFILHAFHAFRSRFWVFEIFLGFFKIDEVFVKFLGWFCINDPKCSCIASHLHYNNVSCILDVCLLCCNILCW